MVEDFPNSLGEDGARQRQPGVLCRFPFRCDAQKEALLRFPDAPQADGWRWGLAYNLARTGDPEAGDTLP